MAEYLYLYWHCGLILLWGAGNSRLPLPFTRGKKPGQNNPFRSPDRVWTDRCLAVILFPEKNRSRTGGPASLQPVPLCSIYPLPTGEWICDPALPAPADRLLDAPGNGVFDADHPCCGCLCSAGQRTGFDLCDRHAI